MRTNEIKNELDDNGGWKKKLEKKKKLKCETSTYLIFNNLKR